MIDDEAIELGARAVACKGWRWLPGMRVIGMAAGRVQVRLVAQSEDAMAVGAEWAYGDCYQETGLPGPEVVPDLRDPATLGCLLALVREAWGDPTIHLTCVDSLEAGQYDWSVRSVADKWSSDLLSDSEAHALVAALEAAP